MLGTPNEKTPMSATEVAERMADLSRQIGSAFGRLQAELVNPVLQRVVYILKKQGRIKIPVINGREIKIKSSSPLAQAQHQQDVANLKEVDISYKKHIIGRFHYPFLFRNKSHDYRFYLI